MTPWLKRPAFPALPTRPPGPSSAAPARPRRGPTACLGRRFFAYLIDILVVSRSDAVLAIAIFVFGIVTLTLGWWLYALRSRRWWRSSTTR